LAAARARHGETSDGNDVLPALDPKRDADRRCFDLLSPSAGIRPENSRFGSSAGSDAQSSPMTRASAQSSLRLVTIFPSAFSNLHASSPGCYKSICTHPIALRGFASAVGLRARHRRTDRVDGFERADWRNCLLTRAWPK